MRPPIMQSMTSPALYDISSPIISEEYPIINSNNTSNGSQIIEPNIITYVPTNSNTNVGSSASNQQVVEQILEQQNSGQGTLTPSSQSNTGTSTASNPNAVPSATTDGTKTYVNGGTTPDSNIIVKKQKPNYLVYGIIGVVGAYVIYKMFFNKKSE